MRTCLCSAALAALLAVCGCSAFRFHNQTVSVTCEPPDAVLLLNGRRVQPPCEVKVRRDRDLSVQAYKEGRAPYNRTIGTHLNMTGTLDIVGGVLVLVPGIGLLTPGAWSLDETDIGITLYRP